MAASFIPSRKLANELCLAIGIDKPVTALNIDMDIRGKVAVRLDFVLDLHDIDRLMLALVRHRESTPK